MSLVAGLLAWLTVAYPQSRELLAALYQGLGAGLVAAGGYDAGKAAWRQITN